MLFDANVVEKLAENDLSIQLMINFSEGEDRISKLSSFFNNIILTNEDLLKRYEHLIFSHKKVNNSVEI